MAWKKEATFLTPATKLLELRGEMADVERTLSLQKEVKIKNGSKENLYRTQQANKYLT